MRENKEEGTEATKDPPKRVEKTFEPYFKGWDHVLEQQSRLHASVDGQRKNRRPRRRSQNYGQT